MYFILWLLLVAPCSYATHLIGGDLSYTCLGSNVYEVKLRIYRDCNSNTQFDQSVEIAVYDNDNNWIQSLFIQIGNVIPVPANSTGNPCVSAPPGLCTEYVDYIRTVNLPPREGGYILTHQRCCRNVGIINVPNSSSFGNTYTVRIPSNDIQCNSTPRFNEPAPIVLCLNQPLNLELNVTEQNGDSLFYELCEVFQGGGQGGGNCNAVIPSPPCAPPYNPVPFGTPFTPDIPLPAAPAFTIDPQTGTITGTPTQSGAYLVGICVSEFRGEELLSKVRLDYQFTVTSCVSTVVSDMVTPAEDSTLLCDGLTVHFKAENQNTPVVFWDFGVPGVTDDTSTALNPTYTFPQPGIYPVRLVARPDLPCSDTLTINFDIRDTIKPDFYWTGNQCFFSHSIDFTPDGFFPPGATYTWEFGTEANFPVVHQKIPPPIQWSAPGVHNIRLRIGVGACSYEAVRAIEISNNSNSVDAGPSQSINKGETVYLKASDGVEFYWWADTEVEISSRITRETSARLEEEDTIKFYVRVKDKYGCIGVDSTLVFVGSLDAVGPINFISPNGDGRNDVFDLSDINPGNTYSIMIMNRWGNEVWADEPYENDWRGVDRGGNELPDGTYYYILYREDKVIYKSAVTLVRNPQGQ